MKRYLPLIVMALFMVGLVLAVRSTLAQEPEEVGPQEALGTTFTYQGQLKKDGNPVNDTCNFEFKLYNAASGGSQVGSTINASVPITDGLFTAQLDFGANAFQGDSRWLGIRVQCPGDSGYADLGRQKLTATPYALSLRPGASVKGTLNNGPILYTYNNGSGTASAGLWGVSVNSAGVYGESTNGIGLSGVNDSATYPAVQGWNWKGIGVKGIGHTNSGIGVYGTAPMLGVEGIANASNGWGVYGYATATSGLNYGVYGRSDSPDGSGVYGYATATGSPGVHGYAVGNSGRGVYGEAWGSSGRGVYGEASVSSGTSYGVYGRSTSPSGYGVYAEATGTNGIGIFAIGGTSGYAADFQGNVRIRSRSTGTIIMELGEGLDYAEGFNVSDKAEIVPGTVLVIDPNHPGKLTVSDKPYDTKVAGIVAGARGLSSGVRLGVGQFDYDVALAGRVYCNVDATEAGVEPGDLLTTSAMPGYAMKAMNYVLAQGAILGKAMERLEKGKRGQILVLVTLQ